MRKFTARSRKNRFQMLNAAKEFLKRAFHHDGVRRYGANTLWLMAEKVIRLAVGFSVGVYVARFLGPAQYGLLNYAISFVALFSIFCSLGLDVILVRELVRFPKLTDMLLGTSFLLKVCGFVVMSAAVGVGLMFLADVESKFLIWIILSGYFFQTFQVLDFYFQSCVLSKYVAISQMLALLTTAWGRCILVWFQAPLWCFAAMEAAYAFLTSVCCWLFYRKAGKRLRNWRFDWRIAGELMRNGLPLLFAGAASLVYLRLDQVMITTMIDEGANGQYAVAVRLAELLFFVPIVVGDSFLPSLVGTRNISEERYRQRSSWLLKGMFYLALAGIIPVALGGSWLIEVLYGEAYHGAAQLFMILCFKMILVYPGMIYSKWMIVENMQGVMLFSTVGGAIVNVILNIFWIRAWGAAGAVWATLASTLSIYLFFPLAFRRGRRAVAFLLRALLPWK
ncbi:flippase [uncultured Victivallis sp.]|uniref:flippase n=1 Tax=uncultured Victivallis sp. TaxID=354118 RepID=UPI002591977C|nr:flippase [uncultured Victivallis sp.]